MERIPATWERAKLVDTDHRAPVAVNGNSYQLTKHVYININICTRLVVEEDALLIDALFDMARQILSMRLSSKIGSKSTRNVGGRALFCVEVLVASPTGS